MAAAGSRQVFLVAAVAGAANNFFNARKSFWFWLVLFLLTGPILNLYMNFQFGFSQFPEVQMHPLSQQMGMRLHEPRDRDYFFIVSFTCLALWAAIGLAAAAGKLRTAIATRNQSGGKAVTAILCTLIFLPAFLPVALNWKHADRSGNYIPQVYARNALESLAPNAIVFTNGDNDTFPLWYIQEVERVRPDVRIVNLSLLNLSWYIRQMRDLEPRVPISLPDGVIDSLRPSRLDKERHFRHGELQLQLPKDFIMYVKDWVVLDIIRTNNWRKPIYYLSTVPEQNRTMLTPYFVLEGIAYRVIDKNAVLAAESDSNLVVAEASAVVNLARTEELVNEIFDYHSFFRPGESGESENKTAVIRFSLPTVRLAQVYEKLGNSDKAIEMLKLANRFMDDPVRDYTHKIAQLQALSGHYEEAAATLDSVSDYFSTTQHIQYYYNLASIAANRGDLDPALMLFRTTLGIDSTARNSYASIFNILSILQRREEAVEIMETYLRYFPSDTTAANELDIYRNGGQFNMQRTFGSPR